MILADLLALLAPHALTNSAIQAADLRRSNTGSGSEPAVSRPAVSEPAVSKPAVSEPAMSRPAVSKPTAPKPAVSKPAVPGGERTPVLWCPPHRDKLFWCFYYVHRGELAYAGTGDRGYSVERETKINAVEILRGASSKQAELVGAGVRLADVEEELVHARTIGICGLCGLCVAYGVRIMYQRGRTYMDLPSPGDCDGVVVTREGCTGLARDSDGAVTGDLVTPRTELYCITSAAKPMRAISAYTFQDLADIARRLEVPTVGDNGKRLLKKALYDNVRARVLEN